MKHSLKIMRGDEHGARVDLMAKYTTELVNHRLVQDGVCACMVERERERERERGRERNFEE